MMRLIPYLRLHLAFALLLILLAPSPVSAQVSDEKAASTDSYLVMLFSPMNKPPFWYFEADQPRGIIFDLLQAACDEQGIELQAQAASRKRGDQQVLMSPHAVVGRALEWVERPERFSLTDPIINNPDILISRIGDPVDYELSPNELEGMIIGTHLGYIYPRLDPLFKNGLLIRSDSSDELNMLNRVQRQRTRAAVMSRPVARWYIKRNNWQPNFYLSDQILSDVQLRLMFNKAQQRFVVQFNRTLTQMRKDGRYQQIIDRYL